ncbi:MAG: sulfotransferase domain-containing protein [Cyclobacteriaceae bacterium]
MLIIAIPKSASTSLLKTLSEFYSSGGEQKFFHSEKKIPENYSILGEFHSDVKDYLENEISSFCEEGVFFKQHIPPTKVNLSLLRNRKKVILLRKPIDIVLAYKRGSERGIHKNREAFDGCHTDQDWLVRAEKIGLMNELTHFHNTWLSEQSDKMILTYEELIEDADSCIKKVADYFGLEPKEGVVELKKYRYSGHSWMRSAIPRIVADVKSLIKKKFGNEG